MKFEPLTILTFTPVDYVESVKLLIFGAKPGTRTDGSSSLLIGGGYSCLRDVPLGSVLVDTLGVKWILRTEVVNGFHIKYIILEEENAHAGTIK